MLYVLTLTATMTNHQEKKYPYIQFNGETENLVSKTIGLFNDKEKALTSLYDYYKRENENHGDKSMIKTYQRGDKVNAEVVTLDADECGNEYMTKVELQSMEEMENLDIWDEVCRNYF